MNRPLRKRELEILLSRIPSHPRPRPDLEQYATPSPIAADLLWRAYAAGDIADRRLLDLGCGTGILAIGASLLGAVSVVGVEKDAAAIEVARETAAKLGATVDLHESDVRDCECEADTVVMNPPFGAQKRGADRPFLEVAVRSAPVVYSLHLAETLPFIREFVEKLGAQVVDSWEYDFPIRAQFWFHDKPVERVGVVGVRVIRPPALS